MDQVIEYVEKKQSEGELSICNIGNGAMMEMGDEGLKKVMENIVDPNTVAKAKRYLIIKVTIQPSSDRTMLAYDVDVSCRLAGMAPLSGTADVQVSAGGRGVIAKARNQQLPLFDSVVPFQKK